ncbi:Nadp-Dependent Malic Enzyme [Manis pentadactyla]|nr:Nadp-Dependent Malic Enzyme [Manis pentadactyla]
MPLLSTLSLCPWVPGRGRVWRASPTTPPPRQPPWGVHTRPQPLQPPPAWDSFLCRSRTGSWEPSVRPALGGPPTDSIMAGAAWQVPPSLSWGREDLSPPRRADGKHWWARSWRPARDRWRAAWPRLSEGFLCSDVSEPARPPCWGCVRARPLTLEQQLPWQRFRAVSAPS